MSRPFTLFTGQYADVPLEELARKAAEWGYDGLELATFGDHFDVPRALAEDGYCDGIRATLERHGLGCWAITSHLVGQGVCDVPIDHRHRAILGPRLWGDGDPEGVRQRCAAEMQDTARAAARLGVDTVVGFTGSSIWYMVAGWPLVPPETVEAGYRDFADRWNPIIDVFDEHGVRFALEVHPTEIAYDYWTTARTLEAIGHRPGFGLNLDPSHFVWQFLDVAGFIRDFAERIYHVDCKDAVRRLDGRNGVLASHLGFGDTRRGWDFVSVGHGEIDWEHMFRMLIDAGYAGPLSVEWEDAGMDRERGAREALAYLRERYFEPPAVAPMDVLFVDSWS